MISRRRCRQTLLATPLAVIGMLVVLAAGSATASVSAATSLNLPGVSVPSVSVPEVTVPGVGVGPVHLPAVNVPSVSLPSVNVPSVQVPSVTVPSVHVPGTSVSTPSVSTPSVSTPSVSTPSVSTPSVSAGGSGSSSSGAPATSGSYGGGASSGSYGAPTTGYTSTSGSGSAAAGSSSSEGSTSTSSLSSSSSGAAGSARAAEAQRAGDPAPDSPAVVQGIRRDVPRMSECLETLSPRAAKLLARRAGLHGSAPQSLVQAARALHIGLPAARRLERRGLAMLRLSYATGGCGGSATNSVTTFVPVSAVVPSVANPNPVAATAGSPSSGGTAVAALPSSVPSSLGEGAVRGVHASGGTGAGDEPRGARGNRVPPAASVADGRDSPANSLADHKNLLLIILALLAIAGGLALIAGQFVAGRRRRGTGHTPRRLAERTGVLAVAAAAPARNVPVWREDGEEESAPPGVLRPMTTNALPVNEGPAAAGPTPKTNSSPDDDTADARGFPRRVPETAPSVTPRAEAPPLAPRGPAPSHRPAVRPRQATLAGAALTVLGALLSVRRRR